MRDIQFILYNGLLTESSDISDSAPMSRFSFLILRELQSLCRTPAAG